jgi:nicotinate phosphoribosyltransferase
MADAVPQPPPPLRPARRLDPDIFQLPVERMRDGYYTDKYFLHARDVLLADGYSPHVTIQAFQKKEAWLGGIDEAIAIVRLCLTRGFDWADLEVRALRDGDRIEPWEPVLEISGPYPAFAHL